MNIKIKDLIKCIAIPLIVGGISAFLTRNSTGIYEQLNRPPLAPPPAVFPIVWTILFVLMGIACYFVKVSATHPVIKKNAYTSYAIMLGLTFFWPIFFFNFLWFWFSFLWLIALWIVIIITLLKFWQISKPAGYCLVPFLLWVTFAGYLNVMVAILN